MHLYPWYEELEETVINSLTTSFGLDFLLFKDKLGGEIDTIQNVRQGVWATEKEEQRYFQRADYDSKAYHTHENYKKTGDNDKKKQIKGQLKDDYRNMTMGTNEIGKRDLDHVISAKEVADDPGRILAELDGPTLANQSSNLQSTHRSINRSMGETPIPEYLNKLPKRIEDSESRLSIQKENHSNMQRDTPEQQHKARELESKIKKNEEKINAFKAIDPKKMKKKDRLARKDYDQEIIKKYYTSSKFWKQGAGTSTVSGLKMGTRQMLGLILAEIWFELRKEIPKILEKSKDNFAFENFIEHINTVMQNIWKRIKLRFQDFLLAFKDGAFSGVMASATTTLFNVFATTQKLAIKIIRETWAQLAKAIKLIIFNPEQLSFLDLCKSVATILSTATATVLGTIVYGQLVPLLNFPFGSETAAFISALTTGVVTLGLNYFLLYSNLAKKLWQFIESTLPYSITVQNFKAINSELDNYLIELSRHELLLDVDQLSTFAQFLSNCTDEIQARALLKEEIAKRNINLPYEIGNTESTQKWLSSLVK